jgi:hypothetical protein
MLDKTDMLPKGVHLAITPYSPKTHQEAIALITAEHLKTSDRLTRWCEIIRYRQRRAIKF